MKLPAVAIAAAFARGLPLGLHGVGARNASSSILLPSFFILITVFVLVGIVLVRAGLLFPATVAAFLGWVLLGFLAVCIAEQPRDADHVVSLLEQGRLPLKTPLRWIGNLRDEPTRLPWGYGYEIGLSGVEFEDTLHPTRGGLRLSFTAHPEGPAPAGFQKTGVFHVLVVAGLHVGALAFALYWVGRKLRLSRVWAMLFTLTTLSAYVAVVEQRAPVLRAAMMAAIVMLGGFFFRRLELLNSAAGVGPCFFVCGGRALRRVGA